MPKLLLTSSGEWTKLSATVCLCCFLGEFLMSPWACAEIGWFTDLLTTQNLQRCKCGIHLNTFHIWVSRYWHLGMVTFGDKIYRHSCVNPYRKSPGVLIQFVSWWMQQGKHDAAIAHYRHNIHSATGNPIPPMPSDHISHLHSHSLVAFCRLANFNMYYSKFWCTHL